MKKLNRVQHTDIYINGRFLTQPITGVQRYAIELVKALDKLLAEEQSPKLGRWILAAPQNTIHELPLKKIKMEKFGLLTGHAWEQTELPLYVKGALLLNLCNTGPLAKKNQAVVMHDAAVYAYPAGFSPAFRLWYKLLFKVLGARAKRIITVSEFSKAQLRHYCGIQLDKIHVIYSGIDHMSGEGKEKRESETLGKHGLCGRTYVFAVSSINPNKNFKAVVDAAALMPNETFVIAGGTNPKVFSRERLSMPENVKYIGYITDEELIDLYQHAACFVYPSLYEGFGFPPLEAMACGCPVLVSNVASLPEICGDAAIYCDPYKSSDIARKIKRLLEDERLRNKINQKRLKILNRFSWKDCAKNLYEILLLDS